jgi:hypothetical protein
MPYAFIEDGSFCRNKPNQTKLRFTDFISKPAGRKIAPARRSVLATHGVALSRPLPCLHYCRRAVTAERLGAGEEGRRVVAGHEDDDLGLAV